MGSGGTVSFYINGTFHRKVALNSQRTAKVRLPARLAKRTHTITAKYNGTSSRTGSKGSARLRVR